MSGELAIRRDALPAQAVQVLDNETEIRHGQAVLDVQRRAHVELREQVRTLRRIVELAVEGANLVDELREAGVLATQDDGTHGGGVRSSDTSTLTLDDLGLSRRRLSEWRSLRDNDALAFLDTALEQEREQTLQRASLNWVRQRVERIAREAEQEDEAEDFEGTWELRHGDFRKVLDDLDGQVDAIITDPPYLAEFLDEFDALGELAKRLLTPNGLLAVMVGQLHLPDYLRRLSQHLTYRWTGAYLTSGPATRIHAAKVGTKWKPILIFDRDGQRDFITQDTFTSEAHDKRHHDWGQSESGFADLISRLTNKGDLVVDPFVGAGTTLVVCDELDRRYVGCDVDAKALSQARRRLAT